MASRSDAQNKPYAEMIAIFTMSWLLVLVGAIIIFKLIVPFSYCKCFGDDILKGVFATLLGGAWLVAMIVMRNVMVRRTIFRREEKKTAT